MAKLPKKHFSDINLSFKAHPVTKKLSVLTNEQAVKRAVRNLVLTNHYERPYQPTLGGNIRAKLFENMNFFSAVDIHDTIEEAILNYEPRAEILDIIVSPDIDKNGMNVKIVFAIINQNEPITVEFFLRQVR